MGNAIESVQRFFGNHFPKIDDYRREVLPVFLSGDVDAREGESADGVVFGKLTLAAVTYAASDDGGVFAAETTDINDVGAADVTLLPATEAVNDAFYFGGASKFAGIKITLSTAGVGDTVVFEYYNGRTWVNLATAHNLQDDSTGFTAGTSTYFITWDVPTDWATVAVNSQTNYYVRARVTAASYTTIPVATQAWLLSIVAGEGVYWPTTGIVTGVSWAIDVASGSTDDTVLQLINLTKGTSTTVTITKATKAGHAAVAAVNGLAFDMGDEFVIQCTVGDASEAADVNLLVEYKA